MNNTLKTNLNECISEALINDYLEGTLPQNEKDLIENHIAHCDKCLVKIIYCYETYEEFKSKTENKTMTISKIKSGTKNIIWLLLTAGSFFLSFFIPKHFLQFLTLGIIFAFKWIFESTNAKILVMIYDAWKQNDRLKIDRIFSKKGGRF